MENPLISLPLLGTVPRSFLRTQFFRVSAAGWSPIWPWWNLPINTLVTGSSLSSVSLCLPIYASWDQLPNKLPVPKSLSLSWFYKGSNPFQYSCLENSTDRGAWQLQSMGSQRVGRDWVTNTFKLRQGRKRPRRRLGNPPGCLHKQTLWTNYVKYRLQPWN